MKISAQNITKGRKVIGGAGRIIIAESDAAYVRQVRNGPEFVVIQLQGNMVKFKPDTMLEVEA